MEPNLEEISDYDKPLSNTKLKNILIGFVILLGVYGIYYLIIT